MDGAFAALKRAYDREGFVRAACHPIVHEIGHAAVVRHGPKLSEVYARGDPFCSAGYFHGATEQIIVDRGARSFVAAPDALCADLGGHARHSIYHRNCAHGIGHGFMLVRRGELPAALRTCDTLKDAWEQRSCYGGVFMQNVMALGGSKYLRPSEPLYPCGELADRHRAMCYKKQAGYALFARNGDIGAVFALCAARRAGVSGRLRRGPGDERGGPPSQAGLRRPRPAAPDARRLRARSAARRPGRLRGRRGARAHQLRPRRRAGGVALRRGARRRCAPGCRRTLREKRTYPE